MPMACWYCPSAKQLRRLRVSSCSRQRGRLENAPVEHALHDGHQPRVRLGRVGVGLAAQLHVLVDGLGCAAVRRREQGWPALRGRQRAHRAAWSQTPTPPSRRTARRRPARTSARRSARPGGKTPAKATPLGFEAGTPATRRPRTLDASSDASWRSAKPSSSANASMRLMADDTSAQCWSTTFSSPLSACTCNSGSDSVKQASRPPAPAAWATINAPGEREKLGERRRFAPVRLYDSCSPHATPPAPIAMPMVAAMGSVALPRSLQTPSSSALRASRAAARRSSRPVSLPCSASAQPPPKKQTSALMRGVWQLAALAVPAREAAPVEQRPKRGSASPRRERGAEKLQFRTIFISDLHLVCAPARMQLRRRARSCCAARKLRLFSWTFGRARARRGARLLRGAARLHLCARRPRPRALWVLRCVASADAPVRALCVPGHGGVPGSGPSGLPPRNRVRNHVPRG